MGAEDLSGLFVELGSIFEAVAAREERDAADDLAMSLRQDRSLVQVLSSGSWATCEDELVSSIREVGSDYAASSSGSLIPLGSLIAFRTDDIARPSLRHDTLLERLRETARAGACIVVRTRSNRIGGRLLAAGQDHLLLRDRGGRDHLVGWQAVESVSRTRGSSADVP